MSEESTGGVDNHGIKSFSLALMDGHCPGESEGHLYEGADFLAIEFISRGGIFGDFPGLCRDNDFIALIGSFTEYLDEDGVVFKSPYFPHRAIGPASVEIIRDKHDLRIDFEMQMFLGRMF